MSCPSRMHSHVCDGTHSSWHTAAPWCTPAPGMAPQARSDRMLFSNNRLDMDLKSLRYFVEVAQHGGFLKTSSRIHVTQPALSRAVQQLEEELGARLLVRGRPSVPPSLTPSGELVFHHAKALLERSALMLTDVNRLNGLVTGTLHLGLPPLGGIDQVAAVLAEFRQRFPQVIVQLLEQGGLELEEAVRKGEVELAISLRPVGADLAWHPICEEPLVVVLPPRHPLANRSGSAKLNTAVSG